MDEATAKRVLNELEKLAAPVNELTVLSMTFPDHEERVAFRRIVAERLLLPCVDLQDFVYRQFPHLDPTRSGAG
jgi:hypothetical protein